MKLQTNYSDKEVYVCVVYFRAIIISLGGLFYGYNNGSFNTTQEHIANMNGWFSDSEQALYIGLITSALPLGCLIGSLLCAQFLKITSNDYRLCLMVTDIIGLLGITEQILDYNLGHFLLGRILSGIAGGLNTSIVPSYLQNFSPPIMKGKIGTFTQIFATLGTCISFGLETIEPVYGQIPQGIDKAVFIKQTIDELSDFQKEGAWRLTIGLPIIMCAIRLFCLIFIYTQETTIQMAQKKQFTSLKKFLKEVYTTERAQKRYDEILEYVKFIQDSKPRVDQENELFEVEQQQKQNNNCEQLQEGHLLSKPQQQDNVVEKQSGNKDIRPDIELNVIITESNLAVTENKNNTKDKKQNNGQNIKISQRRRLILGMVVQTASQVCGFNALIFFSKSIFQQQYDNKNIVQTYLLIQGAAGFIFIFSSMFFIEKFGRKQLLIFSTVCVIIAQLGIAIFSIYNIFILSFVYIIVFLFGFGIGLGGVTWPYIVELVDSNLVSYCSAIRWIWVLIIGITFRFMVIAIGISGTFFVYLGCTILCLIYFLKEMKETKGLNIEQVDILYSENSSDLVES